MAKKQPPKKNTVQINVNLWWEFVDRIDRLIPPMTETMRAHGSDSSRSSVVRAAVYEGIKVLEAQYLPPEETANSQAERPGKDDTE